MDTLIFWQSLIYNMSAVSSVLDLEKQFQYTKLNWAAHF